MQKTVFIIIGILLVHILTSCTTTGTSAGDSNYTETVIRLQRRIDGLEARNSELETRLGEFIAENQRYADYYRSATATIKSSLDSADGKAGSLEERIDRLLRINDQLTELIQRIAGEEHQVGNGEQITGQNN